MALDCVTVGVVELDCVTDGVGILVELDCVTDGVASSIPCTMAVADSRASLIPCIVAESVASPSPRVIAVAESVSLIPWAVAVVEGLMAEVVDGSFLSVVSSILLVIANVDCLITDLEVVVC